MSNIQSVACYLYTTRLFSLVAEFHFSFSKHLVAQKGLEPLAQAYETRMFDRLHYRARLVATWELNPTLWFFRPTLSPCELCRLLFQQYIYNSLDGQT